MAPLGRLEIGVNYGALVCTPKNLSPDRNQVLAADAAPRTRAREHTGQGAHGG